MVLVTKTRHKRKPDMKKTALILYYTRSQNTASIAKAAESAISTCGWEITRLPLTKAIKEFPTNKPSLLILGTPVQYWTVPEAAMKLIQNLPDMNGAFAFVYSCYGGCVADNVPYKLAKEMNAKGAMVIGGAQFLTPHSCRTDGNQRLGDIEEQYGKGQPNDKTLSEFTDAITLMIEAIDNNTVKPIEIDRLKINTMGTISTAMNFVSPLKMKRAFMPPVTVDQSTCKGCETCTKVCDTGSIRLNENGIAKINKKTCYRCYGCIEACPHNALTTNWKQAKLLVRSMNLIAKDTGTSIVTSLDVR